MSETRGKMKKGGFRLFVVMAVMMVAFAGLVTFQAFGADESDAADESYEASVVSNGVETKYATLEGAFAAAQSGDKIVLLKSVSEKALITINGGKELTFDLNGNSVHFKANSSDSSNYIGINGGSLKIIGEGAISEKQGGEYYAPVILYGSVVSGTENYSKLYVGSNVTLKGCYGIMVDYIDGHDCVCDGVVVDLYGKVVAVRDPTKYCGAGLYVNGNIGSKSLTSPIITINVYPGSSIKSDETGIYAAGYAQWNISGGSIKGITGIEIRAGVLNLTDSVIVATGSPTTITPNSNGSTTGGAGIAVAQHDTELSIRVTINGGSISGYTALNIANPEENPDSAIAKVSVEVNGGTFASNNGGKVAVSSISQITGFIKGGSFSSDVSKYLAADYDQKLINGFYTVFLHKETTDDSGTTTTEIVYPDGTKETEVKDASGTVTKETERPDGTKETEVTDATGASQKTTISKEVVAEVEISITTVVEKDSDGNVVSAESKAGFTADSDGNVSTAVVEATITAMGSSGESDLSKTISIESETEKITFEEAAVTAISSSGAVLEFTNKAGTLTADQGVISTLADQSYSLTLSFSETENDTLSKAQQKVVGDSTAYSLALIRSDGVAIHNLNGTVTVSVEYTPSEGTSLSDIQVIYVDDNGKMEAIDTKYDSGILTFNTDHFSCFMIGTSSMLPTDPVIVPSYDDDDYYPIVPVTPASTSSNDDDTKTIVACAAAAVAAALAVTFFLVDSRRP